MALRRRRCLHTNWALGAALCRAELRQAASTAHSTFDVLADMSGDLLSPGIFTLGFLRVPAWSPGSLCTLPKGEE